MPVCKGWRTGDATVNLRLFQVTSPSFQRLIPREVVPALAFTLVACGGAPVTAARGPHTASLVEVPTAPDRSSDVESGSPGGERLPRAEPIERKDPLDYFVGTWDGLAMASNYPNGWETVLVVDGYGSFSVRHETPYGKVCEIAGKLLPGSDRVTLEVARDTCNPQRVGGLERPILSKTDDEFVLHAPEYDMTFHYRRRSMPPGD